MPLALALERAKASSGLDLRRARARAGFSRGHLLEIVLALPGGSGSDAERDAAEELVWSMAGRARADAWIGSVEVVAAPRGGPLKVLAGSAGPEFSLELAELVPALEAALGGLEASLPETPLFRAGGGDWTLFELEPEAADDYARKDDLVMAVTRVPELLKCYLEHAPFSSQRFSRHGELFFHLKYESRGAPEGRLAAREELEAVLERSLVQAEAGRVVGGGLGLRYSYVDFVLSAIGEGLERVRTVAHEKTLPKRAWIECFDDALRAQWIEIQANCPAPP